MKLFKGAYTQRNSGLEKNESGTSRPVNRVILKVCKMELIIIIIILLLLLLLLFINCNLDDARWQWLFYMYTKYDIGYY
jgi:uncharacterized integral membrane protein